MAFHILKQWSIDYQLKQNSYTCSQMAIELFTDGASSGNPGPGGYGAILRSGQHYKELSQGFRKTTNNRMELLAVIKGLEALKSPNQQVTIFSDSKYVIDSVEKKWLQGWVKKGFAGKKNKDLWLRYLEVSRIHHIKFVWVKGHAGHPENERCDQLAVAAGKQKDLLIDAVFETESMRTDPL
jgi:ribonuclease HI